VALRTASAIFDGLVTNAEAVDSSGRRVVIANVERVRGLEARGDVASSTRDIVCLVVIVVEENELFAVCKLIQNATFTQVYPYGEATRQAESARRTR
jgi:hypothetical protein